MERPKILPSAVPHYNSEHSPIPDSMRVSFSDGSTAVYDLRMDQPHPVILRNIEIIRKWEGYKYQPKRRRKRA